MNQVQDKDNSGEKLLRTAAIDQHRSRIFVTCCEANSAVHPETGLEKGHPPGTGLSQGVRERGYLESQVRGVCWHFGVLTDEAEAACSF